MSDVNLLPYTPPTHWAPSRNTHASVELVKMNLPGPEHDMNITWLAEYFAKPGPRSAAHLEFERKIRDTPEELLYPAIAMLISANLLHERVKTIGNVEYMTIIPSDSPMDPPPSERDLARASDKILCYLENATTLSALEAVSNLEESCSLGEKIEAKQVLRAFGNGVGFFGADTERKVVRIDRIQNDSLMEKYQLCKAQVAENSPSKDPNERLLFHGSPRVSLDSIIRGGFDLSFARATGSLGAGHYFALNSSYSHSYSSRSLGSLGYFHTVPSQAVANSGDEGISKWDGKHAMLLCRVALGRVTGGMTGLKSPPEGFDSVDGCNQSIFAVFDNHQAYPAYVIYYN